jgi:hypothetical protein
MTRIFCLILLIFTLPGFLLSQNVADNFPLLYAKDTCKNLLLIKTDNYYNSNAIHNNFLSSFYKGGFIDSLSKTRVSNKLNTKNNLGAEISFNAMYYLHNSIAMGNAKRAFCINTGYFEYYNTTFSENLFSLIFFGNKQFAGNNISLALFNYQKISGQKIGFGIYNKNSFSSVCINFYNLSSYQNYNVNRANFFTEANGQYITLNINEQITITDTNRRNIFSNNGWGLGTDIVLNLNTGKNRSATIDDAFTINIENFGFAVLNSNTLHQAADTTINYSGFQVNNILNINNLLPVNLTDTLKLNYTKASKNILLPFTVTIGKIPSRYTTNRIESFYGIRYRYASNYKPLFYAGVFIKVNPKFHTSVNLQTGGYGNFNLAMQINYNPLKNFWVSVGCSNLSGTLSGNLNGKAINGNIYVAF